MQLKTDDSGKPVLQDGKPVYVGADGTEKPIDVADLFGKLNKLSDDLDRHRRSNGEALKPWEGLDPAKVREELSELAKLRKVKEAGDAGIPPEKLQEIEAQVEQRLKKAMQGAHEEQVGKLSKQLETLHAAMESSAYSREAAAAVSKHGLFPSTLEEVEDGLRRRFAFDPEKGALVPKSRELLRADGEPHSPETWVAGTKADKPHWWPSKATGGGAAGGGGAATGGKTVARSEFDSKPPAEQMRLIKAGVQVTD